jgi:hypothetical protein
MLLTIISMSQNVIPCICKYGGTDTMYFAVFCILIHTGKEGS